MQAEVNNPLPDEEEMDLNVAIIVTDPNVNLPPSGMLLNAILQKTEEFDITITEESIFVVGSLREVPLLVQSLSESLVYDGIIVIDIISPTDNMTKLLLPSITSAIYQAELDNGTAVYQAIYFQSDISGTHSGMAQLAESTLKQTLIYISQNIIIRMNGVEFSEDMDDENPF
ncbi:hypothetical protein [Thorsellia anophelis]|uniref:Uncharacterized protein n=1 Tax=Thorsellia anophelis DSM 18579 TaxID=1123402 RepID=A0A1I0C903_9GAMM|nr:hypothetical protein [Thorsellia anophelis]SET15871.1 hypothetical protein SAMN02583745_01522 [Thorsellia anophelis DSM 18579]